MQYNIVIIEYHIAFDNVVYDILSVHNVNLTRQHKSLRVLG